MKKTFIAAVLIWAVSFMGLHVYAQQDNGTDTEYGYFRKPGTGDYGADFRSKQHLKMEKADRAINVGNLLKWSLEYPVSGDNYGGIRVPTAVTITKVIAVLHEDGAETVTINFKHGTDRSSGTDLFGSNQAISSKTTGDSFDSFSDATLAANEWIWLVVTANSGVVEAIDITIELSVD